MIHTLLIANRGEIACRIIRACRRLGIRAVAVYADADAGARHVRLADEAIHIGPSPAAESYLAIERILDAARRSQADAIHPGFGFLAENAEFARACATAGFIFIGPGPEAIEAMGNKRAAKMVVSAAGVPVIPGYHGTDQRDDALQQAAGQIGFPLMVKAAAGGGGKGMRLVHAPDELLAALAAARREAQQAFGSADLLLERALIRPRHIEFQVVGDQHGNLIHLGERECSIQRRHQKVIEEAPAPGLSPTLRARMGEAAVRAARAVHYTNAGTVEFLLDENGDFYFLEMNTRLQVEHPVTEMVTGIDLVAWQIRLAEGAPLPLSQEVALRGHAIEARLYAENPANDFLPATGPVLLWREPTGDGLRVESGVQTGDDVSIYYDPMLAKIIAHGPDRPTAVRRLIYALETATLLGLSNNLTFLRDALRHPAFLAGDLSTRFIEERMAGWQPPAGDHNLALIAATLAQFARHPRPPIHGGYWRNNPNRPLLYRYALSGPDEPVEVTLAPQKTAGDFIVTGPDGRYAVTLHEQSEHDLVLSVAGHRQRVVTAVAPDHTWWVQTRAGVVTLQALPLLPAPTPVAGAGGSLRAPMPGAVLAVLVEVGQRVRQGQALMKLEAMKMEHTIRTMADGVVEAIYYTAGDTVEADAHLLQIGRGDDSEV
jgi:geranyl-CoA carboxylase alpha subunit